MSISGPRGVGISLRQCIIAIIPFWLNTLFASEHNMPFAKMKKIKKQYYASAVSFLIYPLVQYVACD